MNTLLKNTFANPTENDRDLSVELELFDTDNTTLEHYEVVEALDALSTIRNELKNCKHLLTNESLDPIHIPYIQGRVEVALELIHLKATDGFTGESLSEQDTLITSIDDALTTIGLTTEKLSKSKTFLDNFRNYSARAKKNIERVKKLQDAIKDIKDKTAGDSVSISGKLYQGLTTESGKLNVAKDLKVIEALAESSTLIQKHSKWITDSKKALLKMEKEEEFSPPVMDPKKIPFLADDFSKSSKTTDKSEAGKGKAILIDEYLSIPYMGNTQLELSFFYTMVDGDKAYNDAWVALTKPAETKDNYDVPVLSKADMEALLEQVTGIYVSLSSGIKDLRAIEKSFFEGSEQLKSKHKDAKQTNYHYSVINFSSMLLLSGRIKASMNAANAVYDYVLESYKQYK